MRERVIASARAVIRQSLGATTRGRAIFTHGYGPPAPEQPKPAARRSQNTRKSLRARERGALDIGATRCARCFRLACYCEKQAPSASFSAAHGAVANAPKPSKQ